MPPVADSSLLNVQPRQRRSVYEALAKTPDGLSTKDLLADVEMSEPNLRESLRKLDAAGLIMRVGRLWTAVPLGAEDPPSSTPEPA
ncbi:MAG TPA: ArsR family transcriptional regulator [Thermoleophilaceae bacterium]|jgi:DNA-binding transcriptional ArsR family regulator|nr:ArsR family transcriptional regulator [Thermoleophilaceae bacterium]